MVMVSARLTRRRRLSYRHDLTNAAIAAPRVRPAACRARVGGDGEWRAPSLRDERPVRHSGKFPNEPVAPLRAGRQCKPLWLLKMCSMSKCCPLYPRKRTNGRCLDMSALCQKRTHAVQQKALYSSTSSASASSFAGTSRPSVLAVLRLMMSSSFVVCMTGRSAGFSPLRMRPV